MIGMTHLNATAMQFEKAILRMMPDCFSSMPEGKLIAGIYGQAFADANKDSSRRLFLNGTSVSAFYCSLVGLDHMQVKEMFIRHCKAYKTHRGAITA